MPDYLDSQLTVRMTSKMAKAFSRTAKRCKRSQGDIIREVVSLYILHNQSKREMN